jgi:hypothetical protein
MSTKGIADIVFCLDASGSMQPCIDAVKSHIEEFLAGLKSNGQMQWDWRLDFIAHHAEDQCGSAIFSHTSLSCSDMDLIDRLYRNSGNAASNKAFFTSELKDFKKGLEKIRVIGDEAPLVALDFCLDLPWRATEGCHRVVILMTDEPFESGAAQAFQQSRFDDLRKKIMALKVMLFIVAPQSSVFNELSAVDKSEYEVVDDRGNGLSTVDFRKVLTYIGKSISASAPSQQRAAAVERGLYNQTNWIRQAGEFAGR